MTLKTEEEEENFPKAEFECPPMSLRTNFPSYIKNNKFLGSIYRDFYWSKHEVGFSNLHFQVSPSDFETWDLKLSFRKCSLKK